MFIIIIYIYIYIFIIAYVYTYIWTVPNYIFGPFQALPAKQKCFTPCHLKILNTKTCCIATLVLILKVPQASVTPVNSDAST